MLKPGHTLSHIVPILSFILRDLPSLILRHDYLLHLVLRGLLLVKFILPSSLMQFGCLDLYIECFVLAQDMLHLRNDVALLLLLIQYGILLEL